MQYEICSTSIETESVFANIEVNNKWSVNFIQNSRFGIQRNYSSDFFSLVEAPLNFLFRHYMKPHRRILVYFFLLQTNKKKSSRANFGE